MLNRKKIMSSVFPNVKPLPESATEHIKTDANDGMVLYRQERRYSKEPASYHCLACGNHGECGDEKPVCSKCGNTAFRAVQSSDYDAKVKESVHYIQKVGDYVILSEYDCYSTESIDVGIVPVAKERFRIVFSDTDYAMFCSMHKYIGGQSRDVWSCVKDAVDFRTQQSIVIVDDEGVYENFWVSKIKDILWDTLPHIQKRLKMAVAGNSLTGLLLPEAEFESLSDSIISRVPVRWHVAVQKFPVTDAAGFEKVFSWCTNCGRFYSRFEEHRNYSNNECKACGDPKHYHSEDDYLFHYISAAETSDGGVVIRVQAAIRDKVFVGKPEEGKDPETEIKIVTRFVNYIYVNSNGQIAFFDEQKNEIEHLQIQPITTRRHYDPFIFSVQSQELLKDCKCLKRTGYDMLVQAKVSPKYFEYLREIPSMEIFAKSKMYMLIQDIMKKEIDRLPAFIRGTSKQKSLDKLSKPQLQSLRSQYVTLKHLDAYMQCLGKDPDALFEDFMSLCTDSHERHVLDILRVGVPGLTIKKIAEYIARVDDMQCCPPSASMQLWADYLRMLRDLECDLTDTKLVYTHSLKREHDKASRKMEQVADERLVADFEKKSEDNKWLEFKDKNISAIVPGALSELYEEGRKLSHCVGSYAKSVVSGRSVIVFLRKNTNINAPYCTVEVRGKKVVQVRGWNNRECYGLADVQKFLQSWSKNKKLELDVA